VLFRSKKAIKPSVMAMDSYVENTLNSKKEGLKHALSMVK